jgi:hypothetical protein
MAELDNIVNISITAVSASPTRANFGTPLILAYHTHNVDLLRTYFDPSDMVTDGFTTTEPAYLMASAIVQQNPRPPSFKVGRLTASAVQTFTFTVTNATEGAKVGLTMTSPLGVATDCFHTVGAAETTTTVATALAALLAALPDSTAISAAAVVTFTASTAGTIWYPSGSVTTGLPDHMNGGDFVDTTVAPGTLQSADLTAILDLDADFYGVSTMYLGATNILDVATWTETNKKIAAFTTADHANLSAGTGIMDTLRDLGYKRSYVQYSGTPKNYGALAIMAQRLTSDPGSDTWAFKQLNGVRVDDWLTATQTNNVTGNNGNYYKTIAGVSVTFDGRSSQGQFIDLQRGLDALAAEIQTRVYILLIANPKVPYTIKGIASVGGEVSAALAFFTGSPAVPGFLSIDPGFEPKVTLPAIENIPPQDKRDRILRNVRFTATAQGAIHKVFIQGTVNF